MIIVILFEIVCDCLYKHRHTFRFKAFDAETGDGNYGSRTKCCLVRISPGTIY